LKDLAKRLYRLIPGFLIFAFGIFLNGVSGLGYAPWDVLNDGLSRTFSITFGQASIVVGIAVVLLDLLLRERLGFGTFLNILLIGAFIDMFNWLNDTFRLLERSPGLEKGLVLCVLSVVVNALASYLYMSAQLGAGPRDSLMVALTRRKKLPVGACRIVIEATVLAIGWLMGGVVGIGTLILVLGNGAAIQLVFRLFRFDVSKLRNESLSETCRRFQKKTAPRP